MGLNVVRTSLCSNQQQLESNPAPFPPEAALPVMLWVQEWCLAKAQENTFLYVQSGEKKGTLVTVRLPLHCHKHLFFLPLLCVPYLPPSPCSQDAQTELTHMLMHYVTFSSFLQIPPILACWPEEAAQHLHFSLPFPALLLTHLLQLKMWLCSL